MWKIAKTFTAKMAKMAFEKIIKEPLNLIFKRRYKTRDRGEVKQQRWWIEVKGDREALNMLSAKQEQIEKQLCCHLEAKAC